MSQVTTSHNFCYTEDSSYIYKKEPKILFPHNWKQTLKNQPAIIDLFCGSGGFSLGFEMEGFQTLLGIDYHKPSIETFLYNRSNSNTIGILGDIRKVNLKSIKSEWFPNLNEVPITLVAGLPCQGFSLNNRKRNPNDPRNHLFWYYLEAITIFKPDFILIENVTGLKSLAKGFFIKEIIQGIKLYGEIINKDYIIEAPIILNAIDYGIPQKRIRLFIFAYHKKFHININKFLKEFQTSKILTVWDAISDLPPLKAGEIKEEYEKPPLTPYQKKLRTNAIKLTCHEAPKHTKATLLRIAKTLPGEPLYKNYPQRIRLKWDEPSPTIIAGGIRPQFQFAHPEQTRGLTVREMARLQSFPDWYIFKGGMVQGRVQVGNAVPPLLAKIWAKIIKYMLKI